MIKCILLFLLMMSFAFASEPHYLFIVVSTTMKATEMVADYNSGNDSFVIFGAGDLSSSSSNGV